MALPTERHPVEAPPPDTEAEPAGFVVLVEPRDRIHFLDWGGPTTAAADEPGVVLIHGLSGTSWVWAPVARRLCRRRRTLAMDLRGHGLSDAPTGGYEPETFVSDVVAVADGAGLLYGDQGVVLVGHGFGASIATWAAAHLGPACCGLVLVDGGWDDLRLESELEPDEFVRTLEEPPEMLRSMAAFLADRKGFDPPTWDADQERAARATVVETHAGKVVPVTRAHVIEAMVRAMFEYRPADAITRVRCPIVALIAADDEAGSRAASLARTQTALAARGLPPIRELRYPHHGHNLMRYRAADVTAAILAVPERAIDTQPKAAGG